MDLGYELKDVPEYLKKYEIKNNLRMFFVKRKTNKIAKESSDIKNDIVVAQIYSYRKNFIKFKSKVDEELELKEKIKEKIGKEYFGCRNISEREAAYYMYYIGLTKMEFKKLKENIKYKIK